MGRGGPGDSRHVPPRPNTLLGEAAITAEAGGIPMRFLALTSVIAAVACAAPALAQDDGSAESRLARVEQRLDAQTQTSAREVQSAVDAYLSTSQPNAALVGGPGSAGYDGGFWIRGGSFLLKI